MIEKDFLYRCVTEIYSFTKECLLRGEIGKCNFIKSTCLYGR